MTDKNSIIKIEIAHYPASCIPTMASEQVVIRLPMVLEGHNLDPWKLDHFWCTCQTNQQNLATLGPVEDEFGATMNNDQQTTKYSIAS